MSLTCFVRLLVDSVCYRQREQESSKSCEGGASKFRLILLG
jgi:hypothetical protein